MDPNATLKEILDNLFTTTGDDDYDRTLELIEALAEWLVKGGFEPGETMRDAEWQDVIIGAYWFCCDYHGGQSSDEYRLQCILSHLYSPGMTQGPEPESSEADVYFALEVLGGHKSWTDRDVKTAE